MKAQGWLYWVTLILGVAYRAVVKAPQIAREGCEAWRTGLAAWPLVLRLVSHNDLNAEERSRLMGALKELMDVFKVVAQVFFPKALERDIWEPEG
jgi:hypothetical protein